MSIGNHIISIANAATVPGTINILSKKERGIPAPDKRVIILAPKPDKVGIVDVKSCIISPGVTEIRIDFVDDGGSYWDDNIIDWLYKDLERQVDYAIANPEISTTLIIRILQSMILLYSSSN